jgi:DNA-binding transcriptional ArsR family regulator
MVERLGWPQPMVSKHLAVLKKVGLVSNRRVGRQRVYRANLEQLKPILDWMLSLEKVWGENLDRLDDYLNEVQRKEEPYGGKE